MGWNRLYELARRQHGAFAIRDAPSAGLTPRAVQARAATDPWPRPFPGVVLVPGCPQDHRTLLTAAQLHLGPSAAASGPSALWLYGLERKPPAKAHLLLPHSRRAAPPWSVIHRSRFVAPDDRTVVEGVSVLKPAFLMLAIAPRNEFDRLLGYALDARQQRILTTAALADRVSDVGRMPGRARVQRVLADLQRDGSDSVFEARVRRELRAAGFEPSTAPVRVLLDDGTTVHLDVAFPEAKVAIECQGYYAHRSRSQLNRDARRDNAIAMSSEWLVLRLTWDRYRHDFARFLHELRATLQARA